MSIIIWVYYLASSNVIMTNSKIVTCWIKVIIIELQRVNFLFMIMEFSEVEFLFYVHDLNTAWLICSCENISIFSNTKCGYILIEGIDLSDGLLFNAINNFNISALSNQDDIFVISRRGNATNNIFIILMKKLILIFFPKSLLIRKFALSMRRLILSEFFVW